MVNNPMLYAAIMTLWLVALPVFLIISSVCVIINVMYIVVPTTACLLIFCSLEAIIIAQWAQWFQITECEVTLSVSILAGSDTRPSRIRRYFPQNLKYQDFWSISSTLKELYCISEAALDVLKIELRFIIGDLNFPREPWFSFC